MIITISFFAKGVAICQNCGGGVSQSLGRGPTPIWQSLSSKIATLVGPQGGTSAPMCLESAPLPYLDLEGRHQVNEDDTWALRSHGLCWSLDLFGTCYPPSPPLFLSFFGLEHLSGLDFLYFLSVHTCSCLQTFAFATICLKISCPRFWNGRHSLQILHSNISQDTSLMTSTTTPYTAWFYFREQYLIVFPLHSFSENPRTSGILCFPFTIVFLVPGTW